MFSNEALNIPSSEDGGNSTQKGNALTIVLNERIVNIDTLDAVKKNKLVVFLSNRYQENLIKIKQFDYSHSSAHDSDFDQLIQLLSVELTTSDMSEAGKSKLIYLLHNRAIQQDKIISQHALSQQSAIVFDDLVVPSKNIKKNTINSNEFIKVPVKKINENIIGSKKNTPVIKNNSANASNLFKGAPTETVLLKDVVHPELNNNTFSQGTIHPLSELKLQPKEGLQAYTNNSKSPTKNIITSVDKIVKSSLSDTVISNILSVEKSEKFEGSSKNERSNQDESKSNFIDASMGMPLSLSANEEDDEEDEIDNEYLFDLKDHFKTHTQTQWPTNKEQMVIEVLHLNAGQVKNVSYLQKGQSFKVTVGSKKTVVAKQTSKGKCLFYFNDQYFNGEIRQRQSGRLSVNTLPGNSHAAMNIPENSDVFLRMGNDTWVIRASTSIRSPQVNQSKTDFKTAYKSLATSTGFHLFVMLFLAITISFNALDNTPKAPEFVKMELPKEKAVVKKEIIKPKIIEKVKPKPVAKIKPKVVKKVKPKAKVKTKPKAKPKAAKKPVKKAQAKPKAGSGIKGNIKKRQVKNSGLLSMLGTNKNAPKRSMAKLTSLDAVASSSSSARLKVSGLKANLKGARMSLPTGELISGSGAANALRSGGVAGIGSVAALNRGGTGKQAVGAMVSADMSRNVKIKGGLTRDQVKSVIDANMDDVTYCYETALMSSPSLGGKIIFEWKVQGSGSVGAVNIKSSSVKSNSIHACIKSAIKSWPFPQPSGGSSVQVSYPFIFDTVGF